MQGTSLYTRLWVNVLWLLAQVQDRHAQKPGSLVMLESPALPVMEGGHVTLRCTNTMPSFNLSADFYKDSVRIGSSDAGNFTIHSVSKSDEGLYKCNMSGGGESAWRQLTVTAAAVILESPVHPVMEGDLVMFRCRKNKSPRNHIADFYQYDFRIATGYRGEMTIRNVSKSHEGPYKCSISGAGESAQRWLSVRAVAVVLVIPVLPVMEGEAVTLHCKNKVTSNMTADFYRDGVFIGRSAAESMTIHTVYKSDEGLYKCSISGAGESTERRLTVRAWPIESLCYDQLPVILYIPIRTVVTILWIGLIVRLCGKNG